MLNLNNIRNKANSINLIRSIRLMNITEHVVKFPFKKFMIDMEFSNRNALDFQDLVPLMKRLEWEAFLAQEIYF